MVQLSSSQDVDLLLGRMGDEGVEWPEFKDSVTDQPIKIKGYSVDKSSLRVTLLDVPRHVDDDTIRTAMAQYGTVEEVKRHHLTKVGMEHIKVNRVSVKLAKDQEVELPTTIFGLGSSTNGEERSIWKVTYPGAPRRCYRCGNTNHMARECRKPPITMQQLERMPAVGEERPGATEEEQQQPKSFPLTFAAVVKSPKFLEVAAEQMREAERVKQEKLAKKEAVDKKREEDRKAKEEEKEAKAVQRRQEEDARREGNLAELAKTLEKTALHKKYIKNLHDQARAEVEETREYEKGLEIMARPGGESSKRLAESPPQAAPLAKKPTSNE